MDDKGYKSLTSLFEQDLSTDAKIERVSVQMILNNANAKQFLLAGNCRCTIENLRTGNRFSYSIKRDKVKKNMYYVYSGIDGGEEYCGYFYDNCGIDYHKGTKGTCEKEDKRIEVLLYVFNRLQYVPEFIVIEHDGKCASCGTELNSADEIGKGLCPMCSKI